jgi:hypothetical protein
MGDGEVPTESVVSSRLRRQCMLHCELAIVLQLLVVTNFKSPVNQITNRNLVSGHLTCESIKIDSKQVGRGGIEWG